MDTVLLKAQTRTVIGKGLNQLRLNGLLPGVLYGSNIEPIVLQLPAHEAGQLIWGGQEGWHEGNHLAGALNRAGLDATEIEAVVEADGEQLDAGANPQACRRVTEAVEVDLGDVPDPLREPAGVICRLRIGSLQ